MSIRRVVSLLSVGLAASAAIVAAAPKKGGKTPAKGGSGSGSGSAAAAKGSGSAAKGAGSAAAAKGSGSGSAATTIGADGGGAGSSVQMTEDAPPKDINGTDENPDAPRTDIGGNVGVAARVSPREPGYPTEEVLRPITIPKSMFEVSIAPHFELDDPNRAGFSGGDALRVRYGITNKIQIGLQYIFAAGYHDPQNNSLAIRAGKAVGVDATYLLQSWVGVRLGVPIYLSPVAASVLIGTPLKFVFNDKFAIGGMDDLLNIKISKFAPTFYYEYDNALAASQVNTLTNPVEPSAHLRLSAYGIYQLDKKLAILGRFGVDYAIGNNGAMTAGAGQASATTAFVRAGVEYTLRKYLDLGGTLGFDDLSQGGSFGPSGYLAVRI